MAWVIRRKCIDTLFENDFKNIIEKEISFLNKLN